MASVQELEVRVKGLEDRVKFIMKIAQVNALLDSGLVGPDGEKTPPRHFRGSMEEMFRLAQQYPTFLESEDNGTN